MSQKNSHPAGHPFWQITLPVLVGLLVLGGLGGWAAIAGSSGAAARWAEISTVLLVIPVLVGALLIGALVGLGIYLVQRLTSGLPSVSGKALEIFQQIEDYANRVSAAATRPYIQPAGLLAGLGKAFSRNGSAGKKDQA